MGKLMRMGTFGNHEVANASQGAQWLAKAELDEDDIVEALHPERDTVEPGRPQTIGRR